MRRYNEFSALWRAPILSKEFYHDVALNWRGIGLRYLFLLAMISWLVVLLIAVFSFSAFLNHDAADALKDFPTIHIDKGVASSDVPQPYIFKGDKDEPLFVFDTTGKVTVPSQVGARMLMTSTELIQEDSPGMVQRHPLSTLPPALFPNSLLDRDLILGWMHTGRNLIIPGGLLCCGDLTVLWRLLFALLLAAIGLALNNAFGGGLTYGALIRLAIVSMTGPLLLDTLIWALGFGAQLWPFLLNLALSFGYMVFAVKTAAQVVKPAAPSVGTWPPGTLPPPMPPGTPNTPPDFDERFP